MTDIAITRLSDRVRVITFEDDIRIVVFFGAHHTFLCDTHLGPESMKIVHEYLNSDPFFKKLVIFNSHSDWDHIWGNCAFPNDIIIGHNSCRERMMERGDYDLKRLSIQTKGQVTIKPPNLTFTKDLCFEDDDIVFTYAPGHTVDSSLCYDRKERILYLGDLVEDPIPYLDYDRLDIYLKTMELLLSHPARVLISAHSGVVSKDLIIQNISYIRSIKEEKNIDIGSLGTYEAVHRINQNTLLMFRYEVKAKQILGDAYDFSSFWSEPPNLEEITQEELEEKMMKYLVNLKKL